MIKVLINNHWESIPKENLQLGTDTFSFSSGLYETFRTLDFKPVFLQPHLDRLFSSANRIGLNIEFTQSDILNMLSKVIRNFQDPNQRVRILAVPNKLIVYTSYLNLEYLTSSDLIFFSRNAGISSSLSVSSSFGFLG